MLIVYIIIKELKFSTVILINKKRIMATSEIVNTLPEKLQLWATKEMGFHLHRRYIKAHQPTLADFQDLCRSQKMRDIWTYVIKHIHSLQTVTKVRGNIFLQNFQGSFHDTKPIPQAESSQLENDSKHSEELKKKLKSNAKQTLSQIWQIETTIHNLQKEILDLEHKYQISLAEISDIRHRIGLLSVYKKKYANEIERYANYDCTMISKIEAIKKFEKKPNEVIYFSSKAECGSNKDNKVTLESSCQKSVRETCEEIEDFMQKMLQGKFGNSKSDERKEHLWSSINKVLDSHSPKLILTALEQQALDAAMALKIKTCQLDIKKDAEKLSFKMRSDGQLIDLSQTPPVLKTVQYQLERGRLDHLKQFLSAEEAKNASLRAECELAKLKLIMDEKFQQLYSHDPSLLSLQKEVFAQDLTLLSIKTSHECLEKIKAELEQNVQRAALEKDQLLSKHHKIQDFKKIVDDKQNLIQILAKQNMNCKSKLELQQKEILQYVQQFSQWRNKTFAFDDGMLQEMKIFNSLKLPKLIYVKVSHCYQPVPITDLSIHHLEWLAKENIEISHIYTACEFPQYKAPECLLPSIIEIKEKISNLKLFLIVYDAASKSLAKQFNDPKQRMEYFKDLVLKVKASDQKQLGVLLPKLQAHLVQATQGMADCFLLKETLQEWWEQPAQFTIPWITVDNLTMRQWMDQWIVGATKLRKLQLKYT